jgi:ketosteroid isomerase-like protein
MVREEVGRALWRPFGRRRRTLDEFLLVGIPGLMRMARWAFEQLPPESRARRKQLRRGMQSQFEAINRRDFKLFLRRCDAEVEFDVTGMAPEGLLLDYEEVYRGHEGVRQFFSQWVEWWDRYHVDLDELIYGEGDRVVVAVGRQTGRARMSGAEIERPVAFVVTFRNALAVHIHAFWDPMQALEAIGGSAPPAEEPRA